jgi:uncharacterized protein involved in outer membrane biogenesis
MCALKWIGAIIGGASGLVFMTLLFVFFFNDVQKYRPEIERQASKAIGAPVLVGELSLSLFPSVGINISDSRIGNSSGFSEEDLLYVRTFHVEVKLLPLLSRELCIERFVFDGPRLILKKSEIGKGGWETLGGDTDAFPVPAT